jgi:hypothetical protein
MPEEQKTDQSKTDASKTSTPPWGDDFDPARAWRLIENLRTEVDGLKTDRDSTRSKLKEREDAEKSDSERATSRASEAEARAAKAERTLLIERATRKHNLPEDVVEFLTGDTEEEINAKAERLAALGGGPKATSETEEPKPTTDLPGKPKPALQPGHAAEGSEDGFDPEAIAKAARERF